MSWRALIVGVALAAPRLLAVGDVPPAKSPAAAPVSTDSAPAAQQGPKRAPRTKQKAAPAVNPASRPDGTAAQDARSGNPSSPGARAAGPADAKRPASASKPATAPQALAPEVASGEDPQPLPTDPREGEPAPCLSSNFPDRSCLVRHALCERCLETARIAWQYFRKNTGPTGLVNAVDGYPSSTLWEAGSSLTAILAAGEFDLIAPKERDDRVAALLAALATQQLYRDELPNKAYSTATNGMTDYANHPSAGGIGYSALDVSRLLSALDLVACLSPKHAEAAAHVASRYNFCRMVKGGQLFGAAVENGVDLPVQEGRTGYEQYAGRALERLGFQLPIASRYHNEFAATAQVEGVPILYDNRDPKDYVAVNYVATESYALDAIENGLDAENTPLLRNLFEAQKRRWQRTGIVTAVTEDHVDRPPYFIYNTIFASGEAWKTVTDSNQDMAPLKSLSVKAAFSLATLFPSEPYSAVLVDAVASAYDPAHGYYAGIYESGIGYNRALTANTNGVVLEMMLYKAYGPLHAACSRCRRGLRLPARFADAEAASARCEPKPRKP